MASVTMNSSHEFILRLLVIISSSGIAVVQLSSLFFQLEVEESLEKSFVDIVVQQLIRVCVFFFVLLFILIESQHYGFPNAEGIVANEISRGLCYVFVGLVAVDQKVIYHFRNRAMAFRGATLGCLLMACGVFYITLGYQKSDHIITKRKAPTTPSAEFIEHEDPVRKPESQPIDQNNLELDDKVDDTSDDRSGNVSSFAVVENTGICKTNSLTQKFSTPSRDYSPRRALVHATLSSGYGPDSDDDSDFEDFNSHILSALTPTENDNKDIAFNSDDSDSDDSDCYDSSHQVISDDVEAVVDCENMSDDNLARSVRSANNSILSDTEVDKESVDFDSERTKRTQFVEELSKSVVNEAVTKSDAIVSYIVSIGRLLSIHDSVVQIVEDCGTTIECISTPSSPLLLKCERNEKCIVDVDMLAGRPGAIAIVDEVKRNAKLLTEEYVTNILLEIESIASAFNCQNNEGVDSGIDSTVGDSKSVDVRDLDVHDDCALSSSQDGDEGRCAPIVDSLNIDKGVTTPNGSVRSSTSLRTSASSAPVDVPKVKPHVPSQEEINKLALESEELKLVAKKNAELRELANTVKSGWLQKCGHFRKNWTRRWFVLEKGVLRYFKSSTCVPPYGKEMKGELHLDHFTANLVDDNGGKVSRSSESGVRFNVYNTLEHSSEAPSSRRKQLFRKEEHVMLEIKAESGGCAQEWIEAINGHIEFFYKSQIDDLPQEEALSEGWLEKKNMITKKWQKRWFVLKANKIEYYDDEQCRKSLGQMFLHSDVRLMTRDGFTHLFKFAVTSKSTRMELSASGEADRQKWLTMINKVCKKDMDDCAFRPSAIANIRPTEAFDETDINIYANTGTVILDDGSQPQQEQATTSSPDSNTEMGSNVEGAEKNDPAVTRSRKGSLTEDMIAMITANDLDRKNLTLEVLRKQLRAKGELPLEFIPLDELQSEIASIFEKLNGGESFDEDRLDYLLHCLEMNPEHKEKLAKENEKWHAEVLPYTTACFEEMRGFIPSHIFDASILSLVDDDGLSKQLAKRFFMKKCLMLVRLKKDDISKMHIAELSGRFNPSAQGLDIVETAAIYHALPETFLNDHDGKKEQWKCGVEDAFKKMYSQKASNSLPKNAVRFHGYSSEIPYFKDDNKYHTFCKESSATDDSDNFLKMSKQKSDKHLATVAETKITNQCKDTSISESEVPALASPTRAVSLRMSAGKIGDGDLQNELKLALNKRNSTSSIACGSERRPNPFLPQASAAGPGANPSMQDELRNVLMKRNSTRKLTEE